MCSKIVQKKVLNHFSHLKNNYHIIVLLGPLNKSVTALSLQGKIVQKKVSNHVSHLKNNKQLSDHCFA